jgi:hypothetical protein
MVSVNGIVKHSEYVRIIEIETMKKNKETIRCIF